MTPRSPLPAAPQAPPPPTVHRMAGIRNGLDELMIAVETLDTGLRYVSMTVFHASPAGPVQDHRRRMCFRVGDIPALVAGLLAAAEHAHTERR